MTPTPQISIIMPCYQQVQFVEEAVRSVLDQTDVDAELLVMDPGSTDGTRERLDALKEIYGEQLQLHYALDRGQADAINHGMALARGRVLGWLNSDDRLHPGALRQVARTLQGDKPQWLYGRCGMINEQGRAISPYIVWYKNFRGRRFSPYKLLTENFIPQMATFWNRALWDQVGGVDIERHLDMDYDLFLKFARITLPSVLPDYFADFRIHQGAKSSRQVFEVMDEALRTAQEHARGLGLRGEFAIILHRLYGLRTRIIYRLIKP
jgi:glycosyltransferase involved in cell wall biosynthesis